MSYWSDPAEGILAITPNDSTDIAACRGILCGTAGNAQVTTVAGNTVRTQTSTSMSMASRSLAQSSAANDHRLLAFTTLSML